MRVALTQSEGKLAELERALIERGHEVVRAPLIETEPLLCDTVRKRARALLECPWLLFTSPSAVAAWQALGLPFGRNAIGTVGAKTAARVEQLGGEVRLVGEPQTSAGLADTFLQSSLAAGPVGLPRGDRALPTLQDALESCGVETRPLVVYRTRPLAWDTEPVDAVVLSSPSAAEALPDAVGGRTRLVALGPSTGAEIAARGWRYAQAARPEVDAVIAALASFDTRETL